MHQKLATIFSRLESISDEIIKEIQGASEAEQHYAPSANDWCMIQVLDHLRAAEELSLQGYRKYGSTKGNFLFRLSSTLRSSMLSRALSLPTRIKAPKIDELSPNSTRDLDTVLREWKETRKNWTHELEAFTEDRLGEKIFRHPYFGMLTACQMLRFFADHAEHHRPQIERLRQSCTKSL